MPVSDYEKVEFARQTQRYAQNPIPKNLPDQYLGDRIKQSRERAEMDRFAAAYMETIESFDDLN